MIILDKLNVNSKKIILVKKENGCIECISHSKDDCGYTRIRYKGKHDRLFRVIYQLEKGDIPKGMVVRHTCDNPSCCNIEHLLLGTQKDNVYDMISRGRSKYHTEKPSLRGTNNKANKLTEEAVKNIYLSNLSCGKLGKLYNVSKNTIKLIKNKKMWGWLTDKLN